MHSRIGFVTCVELGKSCIDEVHRLGGRFDLFITLRDGMARAKSGRVYLDEVAAEHDTPLVKVRHINDSEAVEAIREVHLDWLFIVGWSQIAGPQVLEAPSEGVLGMHPTLLPEGRGRAAIPWAILKGLPKTGVTLFKLDTGVDTGPVVDQVEIPLAPDENAATLYSQVNDAHRELMRKVWPTLVNGTVKLQEQDESRATEWPGRRPEDGKIQPDNMTVEEVDRLVRAVTRPYPGAFVDIGNRRYTIWAGKLGRSSGEGDLEIACSDGFYTATEVEHRRA